MFLVRTHAPPWGFFHKQVNKDKNAFLNEIYFKKLSDEMAVFFKNTLV